MGACKQYSTELEVEDVGETLVGCRVCSLVLSSVVSIRKAGWAWSSTGECLGRFAQAAAEGKYGV